MLQKSPPSEGGRQSASPLLFTPLHSSSSTLSHFPDPWWILHFCFRSAHQHPLHGYDSRGKRLLSVRLHSAEWRKGRQRRRETGGGGGERERERKRELHTAPVKGTLVIKRTWRPCALPKSFSIKPTAGYTILLFDNVWERAISGLIRLWAAAHSLFVIM